MFTLAKSTFFDALRILVAIICLLYFVAIGYQIASKKSPLAALHHFHPKTAAMVQTGPCSQHRPLNLSGVKNAQLAKLATYQRACHSYVTGTMMTFVGIPTSDKDAAAEAKQVAATLKSFSVHHVRPLVMAEPRDYTTSKLVDMGGFAKGDDTAYLSAMFAGLQRLGIKPDQMGIWNPFPEANIPQWSNSQPQYFAPSVNIFVSTLEQSYAGTQTSIMLSSASYQPSDTALKNGEYVSLMPYLTGITPGTINYAGLEGFPWLPPRGQTGAMVDVSTFLKQSIISETANYLGTKNIWLNTGTQAAQYTQQRDHTAKLSAAQRRIILDGIYDQAYALQRQGYHVTVNLFAQDKSNSREGTDWSYWHNNDPASSVATPVFTDFAQKLDKQHIGLWLFDQ